ncbi:hypothetical protein H4S06_006805, partial [Coemansia sp. BCRC 34490]
GDCARDARAGGDVACPGGGRVRAPQGEQGDRGAAAQTPAGQRGDPAEQAPHQQGGRGHPGPEGPDEQQPAGADRGAAVGAGGAHGADGVDCGAVPRPPLAAAAEGGGAGGGGRQHCADRGQDCGGARRGREAAARGREHGHQVPAAHEQHRLLERQEGGDARADPAARDAAARAGGQGGRDRGGCAQGERRARGVGAHAGGAGPDAQRVPRAAGGDRAVEQHVAGRGSGARADVHPRVREGQGRSAHHVAAGSAAEDGAPAAAAQVDAVPRLDDGAHQAALHQAPVPARIHREAGVRPLAEHAGAQGADRPGSGRPAHGNSIAAAAAAEAGWRRHRLPAQGHKVAVGR